MQLLPVTPAVTERDAYVSRILAAYASATDDQRTRGADWYPAAHLIAGERLSPRIGAGILAAYSPLTSWEINVRLARHSWATGEATGHTGDAVGKVARILSGQDPTDVLPMASKTGQFFLCIADPADPDAVVIDRHAHDIVAGRRFGNADRGLSSVKRYASIADAYRQAGKSLGIVPSVLQAVTWTVQVDAYRWNRSHTASGTDLTFNPIGEQA